MCSYFASPKRRFMDSRGHLFTILLGIRTGFQASRASLILLLFYLHIIFISVTFYLFEEQYFLTLLYILSLFLLK